MATHDRHGDATRPHRRSRGRSAVPRRSRSVGARIGSVLLTVLAVVPLLGLANLCTGAAVVSAIDYLAQTVRGTVAVGTLTDTTVHTVHSTRGPDEHECLGRFSSDDGRWVEHRVRVWASADDCDGLRDATVRLMPGSAAGISDAIAGNPEPSLSEPIPFGGLFGLTDGVLTDDAGAFVAGLWPYLFLAPIAVIGDVVVIGLVRSRVGSAMGGPRSTRRRTSS